MSNFYNQASWVLVPSGIEEDIVFAQKPISGLGDLSYTRASDATYTDSTGVVRRSPYNLLQQSEMFSNAIWTKTGSTIGIDATVAPNGTLTADKLIEDTALSTHLVLQLPAGSISGNIYTFSFYAKAAERFNVSAVNNAAGGGQATYNLNTGVVTFTSGISASMQSVGNGWYRCILTYSPTVTGNFNTHIRLANASGANSYQGDGVSGAFIWGAQLVEGTSALDYFPTTNRQDVPRIDFRNADGTLSSCGRLLLEPQRTNSIRNSSMVGAVAGSPGTLPTNWVVSAAAGLTQTVVAAGTENGLPYVDLRFNGTASASALRFTTEASTAIAALPSQIWTNSCYFKLVAGVLPYITLRSIYRNSGAGAISTPQLQFDLTTTLTRRSFTDAASPALTAFIQQEILVSLVIGQTFDFTIRIAAPQMELGAYATTWVPTTTAAVTRIGDSTFKTGLSSLFGTEGTWYIEMSPSSVGVSTTAFKKVIGLYQVNGSIADSIYLEEYIGTWGVFVRKGNSTILSRTYGTQPRKLAVTFGATGSRIYIDGVQAASTASNTSISPVQINTRESAGGAIETVLNVSQMAYFPTPLTQSQLAQLTTL